MKNKEIKIFKLPYLKFHNFAGFEQVFSLFLPYVIKFMMEENVDLETLTDTNSNAFKDYFRMLKSHLPRVTEFIDTFQLKVVENSCETPNSSSHLEYASQESESGIESMASTRR